MADDSGIDPRYAAQFQRGFDPAQHPVPPVRRGPEPLAGGPAPTAERVPDPPPMVPRAEPEPVAVPDESLPTPRSRLEWALLGGGVALLVAAGALFVGAVQLQARYSGWSPGFEGHLYGAATEVLPGPLLVAGVIAIVLWVVLRVISADRRSR